MKGTNIEQIYGRSSSRVRKHREGPENSVYCYRFNIGIHHLFNGFLEPAGKCFRLDEGSNSLGLSFSYTLEMVQNFFDLRNQEQLDCYSEFLRIWDILFAIIYTTMYSSWMMFFIEKKRKLLAFPILAMVADWSENLVEVMMINKYTQGEAISETTVMIGSSLNSLKWILQSITFTILLVGIISKSFLKIKAMKNDSEE